MQHAFVVQHLSVHRCGKEDAKLIGVYSSESAARAAVDRLKIEPGFRDSPRIVDPIQDNAVDGFYIDRYTVDEDNWTEGFGAD